MMESFWIGMANHLWQTSGLILLLLGIERGMGTAPGRWLERLWWVALAGLVLPVGWLRYGFSWLQQPDLAAAGVIWTLPQQVVQGSLPEAGSSKIFPLLTIIWLLGVLVHWLLLVRNLQNFRRWKDCPLKNLNEADRLLLARQIHPLSLTSAEVRWTGDSVMPMVVGLFQPRIVLPLSLIRSLDADQLRAVLLHEDSHRRRRDPLRLLVYSLVKSVMFIHPLWPLVQRRLIDAGEFISDENSLASGLTGHRYAQTLAGTLALRLKAPHLSAAAGLRCRTSLSARINRFNLKEGNENMLRYRMLLGLALGMLVVGMMVSMGCQADSQVGDELGTTGLIEGAEVSMGPRIIHWEAPRYPDPCRKEGISGTVRIRMLVDAEGGVAQAEVMDGPECLWEAALTASKSCRFHPGTQVGQPVNAWVVLPYEFRLE